MKRRQIPKGEVLTIEMIIDRALSIAHEAGIRPRRLDLFMALCFAHRAMPLDLDLLAKAPDVDLAHDVFGILRHIDPKTGNMRDYFVPRTARFQHE
jgi:hypothetical protein